MEQLLAKRPRPLFSPRPRVTLNTPSKPEPSEPPQARLELQRAPPPSLKNSLSQRRPSPSPGG
eukprot:scaffold265754_cov24-Tisochrysis_lutea.AAC.1